MKNPHYHSLKFQVFTLLLFSIFTSGLLAQPFNKKDLIGKWQSSNAEKVFEMIVVDSSVLYMKTDGNPALNNTPLTYSIDSLHNHALLLLRYPNGFTMKLIFWVQSQDEVRLFAVEPSNYKDPLKEIPGENSKKIIILKRSRNGI